MRTVQVLLGHESLETTMIDAHVARKGPAGVTSPLDLLADVTAEAIEGTAASSRELQTGRQSFASSNAGLRMPGRRRA